MELNLEKIFSCDCGVLLREILSDGTKDLIEMHDRLIIVTDKP